MAQLKCAYAMVSGRFQGLHWADGTGACGVPGISKKITILMVFLLKNDLTYVIKNTINIYFIFLIFIQ